MRDDLMARCVSIQAQRRWQQIQRRLDRIPAMLAKAGPIPSRGEAFFFLEQRTSLVWKKKKMRNG
jgi:hypothetical protein